MTAEKVEDIFVCGTLPVLHHKIVLYYIAPSQLYFPHCPEHGYMRRATDEENEAPLDPRRRRALSS